MISVYSEIGAGTGISDHIDVSKCFEEVLLTNHAMDIIMTKLLTLLIKFTNNLNFQIDLYTSVGKIHCELNYAGYGQGFGSRWV